MARLGFMNCDIAEVIYVNEGTIAYSYI
jgi:hypothetical protein